MDTEELERHVTLLLDIEAIKRLMADYCDIADDDHNQDRIVTIFAEDGIWEGEPFLARGHDEIRALFGTFAEQICFSQHNVFNPRIDVNGDKAFGTHYFIGPFTYRDNDRRCWIIARSEDDFVKIDGVWKIKHHRGFGIEVPVEEGWPKSTPPEVFGNLGWRGRNKTA